MSAPSTLILRRPDDWHVHLRDGAMLAACAVHTARQFARAIIMPNLVPPVTRVAEATAYRERIRRAVPADLPFESRAELLDARFFEIEWNRIERGRPAEPGKRAAGQRTEPVGRGAGPRRKRRRRTGIVGPGGGEAVNAVNLAGLVLAVALTALLVAALLFPERF